MAAHLPTDLVTLAAAQGRCFTVAQAGAAGVDPRVLRRLATRGIIVRRHAQVYGLAGDASWRHRVWAAALQLPSSVVSHESAGRLHRVPAMDGHIALIVASGSHPRPLPGVRLHQIGPVRPAERTEIDGLPVTSLDRTICDLAAVVHPARLRHLLDHELADRRTTLDRLGAVLASVSRSGRPGGPALGRLLDERQGAPMARSVLERWLDRCLDAAGLHDARCEYPLPIDDSLRGFVDRAFPAVRLIVEADGRRWHTRAADFARDRSRDRLAARHGWLTVRVAHEELRSDPDGIATDLAAIHASRRVEVGGVRRSA